MKWKIGIFSVGQLDLPFWFVFFFLYFSGSLVSWRQGGLPNKTSPTHIGTGLWWKFRVKSSSVDVGAPAAFRRLWFRPLLTPRPHRSRRASTAFTRCRHWKTSRARPRCRKTGLCLSNSPKVPLSSTGYVIRNRWIIQDNNNVGYRLLLLQWCSDGKHVPTCHRRRQKGRWPRGQIPNLKI